MDNLILLSVLAASVSVIVLSSLLLFVRAVRKVDVFELTPPSANEMRPEGTEAFLSSVLESSRRLNGLGSTPVSLEISASRHKGTRYHIVVPRAKSQSFIHALKAHLPSTKYRKVKQDGSRANTGRHHKVAGLIKSRSGHSLKAYDSYQTTDPIRYVLTSVSQLNKDETVCVQLLVCPSSGGRARVSKVFILPFRLTKALFGMFANVVFDGYSPAAPRHVSNSSTVDVQRFRAELRILSCANTKIQVKERTKNVVASYASYGSLGGQRLIGYRSLFSILTRSLRRFYFTRRMFGLTGLSVMKLSIKEIAVLYHFPYGGDGTEVESVAYVRARELPLSSHMRSKDTETYIGHNMYHEQEEPVGLSIEERQRHVYIVGGTGNGKTTMLQSMAMQDIHAGKGVAIVDPHGDMADAILARIPRHRMQDVVLINPDDIDFPVSINLLELDNSLSGNAKLRERDLVTESVISILRKIFSEEGASGHRIEYILRNAVHTALTVPGATLFTVLDLINDMNFRMKVIAGLSDQKLRKFWINEFGKAGDFQRVKMTAGVTAKLGRFEHSVAAKSILGSSKSTIDFDQIMKSKKILLCKVSKGLLGEDTASLLGMTVLAKMQLAILKRARYNENDRVPYYIYVDEFQNFATQGFTQLLSEARKYRTFLTIAQQTTAQQADSRATEIILANIGTLVCFQSGSPLDERVLLGRLEPQIGREDMVNLPPYMFYARIFGTGVPEVVSGHTVRLIEEPSLSVARQIKKNSRAAYSVA